MTKLLIDVLNDTERLYHGAIQAGLFIGLDTGHAHMQDLVDIEDALQRCQVDASVLRQTALQASGQPWKELVMVWNGQSYLILRCILAVRKLQSTIEILKESRLREVSSGSGEHQDSTSESSTSTDPAGDSPTVQPSTQRTPHLRHLLSFPCNCNCGSADYIGSQV